MNKTFLLLFCFFVATSVGLLQSVPVVGGAAVAVGAIVARMRKSAQDRKAFFSVNWADPPASDAEDEGCYVLGEETVPGGKTWYVCSEPNEDPRFECESVETNMGNPYSAGKSYLCKEQPVTEKKKPLLRNPFAK